jgi:hypothetical protein
VTGPVRPATSADQAWAQLAADLTPARSLARIDTVTARAITTVTIVGVLLTGLGAVAAAVPAEAGTVRALAIAAVIAASLAVAAALTAQVLTITRRLNPANLTEVRTWYHRQFELRAYPTQAATILLLAAALLAGAAAATALFTSPASTPTLTITQAPGPDGSAATAQSTVTVSVTFRGLAPGQPATLVLTTPGVVGSLARAAATGAPDGTAETALTALLPATRPLVVTATTPGQSCQATLSPATAQPALTCHTS